MPRVSNAVPQYLDDSGNILAGGQMRYYNAGTSTDKVTYSDEAETVPNTNPVILDAAGRLPNVFFSGTAKQVLSTSGGVQLWERDNVGSNLLTGDFNEYNSTIDYSVDDIVKYNSTFYVSLQTPNQAQAPNLNANYWAEIRFIDVYNVNVDYTVGEVCQTIDGNLWKSIQTPNANQEPSVSPLYWLPSVDGGKVPELIANTALIASNKAESKTVIPQTGGGTLTTLRVNELRDGSTYTLPLANSVSVNQTITITLPDKYSANTPTVQIGGTDTITDSTGTDTSILFDSGSVSITLTSDGILDWGL